MDMWNLDVLRHLVPPFCVSSSLSNFQVHVIRLVSAPGPYLWPKANARGRVREGDVPPPARSAKLKLGGPPALHLNTALLLSTHWSYLLIELHARNCKVVVLLWKPFHKCFAHFRRKWDPNPQTTFSTFITLTVLLCSIKFKEAWKWTYFLSLKHSFAESPEQSLARRGGGGGGGWALAPHIICPSTMLSPPPPTNI